MGYVGAGVAIPLVSETSWLRCSAGSRFTGNRGKPASGGVFFCPGNRWIEESRRSSRTSRGQFAYTQLEASRSTRRPLGGAWQSVAELLEDTSYRLVTCTGAIDFEGLQNPLDLECWMQIMQSGAQGRVNLVTRALEVRESVDHCVGLSTLFTKARK